MSSQLKIDNLQVKIDDQQILKGVNLTIQPGEIHAVMGPNGSGKSTLAKTLAGHPDYEITHGEVLLDDQKLLDLSVDDRAKLGLFLAFQYPTEIPGVKVQNFLRQAHSARFEGQPDKQFDKALAFRKHLAKLAEQLEVSPALLERGLNEGFSGGEKKRLEILQMAVLEPKFAVLDETDSGLDIDAIKAVAKGVKAIVQKYNTGAMVITHYQRILDYLTPDYVHIMIGGKIVETGSASLVAKLEEKGYQDWRV